MQMILSLPKPLIEQLGLTPVRSRRTQTTNGIVTRTVYSDVRVTVLEQEGTINDYTYPNEKLQVMEG